MNNHYIIDKKIIKNRMNIIQDKINYAHFQNTNKMVFKCMHGIELEAYVRLHFLLGEPAWGKQSAIYYIHTRY